MFQMRYQMKKTDPKVLKAAYKSIFNGDMGKIVMNDLKDWCNINKTSFDPDRADVTSFNEGKRFVYLRICSMAKIDLDKLMQREG
jgi:hypothetical protein